MSMSKHGLKWSEDETILVFYYYKCVQFGSIDMRNPEIIRLAALLGRTPSSVAMKMWNLANFDPEQQKRMVSGLKNASKTDAAIVKRFANKQDELCVLARTIENAMASEANEMS